MLGILVARATSPKVGAFDPSGPGGSRLLDASFKAFGLPGSGSRLFEPFHGTRQGCLSFISCVSHSRTASHCTHPNEAT